MATNDFFKMQADRGIDIDGVIKRLGEFAIETPSWGYGDSGTRFKVFRKKGVPRNPFEKFDDAGEVHRLTGAAPSVAIHIPWDNVEDYDALRRHAAERGVAIGAINPNVFQDDKYQLGSVCNSDPAIRKMALDHMLECVEIMRKCDSKILSLWFADGTNYPGQGDIRARKRWMEEALQAVHAKLDADHRMLIEYKFYEPAFYHTDIADWGMAYVFAQKCGAKAEVLVDTGHHAQGTNVEHIVSFLLDEGKLGGFHFNGRKYGDDDLIVGAINPYELFLIFVEIIAATREKDTKASATAARIAYMIDQSHNIEPKIPAMIRSILNCQINYAKALLVDYNELRVAREKNDVLGAEAAVREAFEFDARPILLRFREERGLPADPLAAYAASGYQKRIEDERGTGGASW